jgi:tetratricopeptide (TPR) repeat protein
MSFVYSAKGLAFLSLARLTDAYDSYLTAFECAKRVGDDGRMSVLASNICVLQTARGEYDNAIEWGELSVSLGESSHSSALQMTYTNLVDPYVLTGRESEAVDLMQRARDWLVPRRRWKFHCGFLVVSAAFELIRNNISLALSLIRDLEEVARDREEAVPIQGAYWKLRIFKTAHMESLSEAERMAEIATARLRDRCPMQYLDILAAKAWLETKTLGRQTAATTAELHVFESFGAIGRRALLTAQGFLPPSRPTDANDPSAPRTEAVSVRQARTAQRPTNAVKGVRG